MCKGEKYDSPCKKIKDKLKVEFNAKKFQFILLVARTGIIFRSYSINKSFNNISFSNVFIGTGLGALFLMVYYCFTNWYKMNDATKLTVLGIS